LRQVTSTSTKESFMNTSLATLAAWWQRFVCRLQEARRRRRDMRQLERMSAHELRDIGFTQNATAMFAAASVSSRCQ
jgi:uncharacterized protein YjiS (DUF1127 family)